MSVAPLPWNLVEQQRATASGVRRPRPVRRRRGAATDLPVARVCVGVTPIHLDRPFDYEVPEALSLAAQPGCRVRVRFAGRLVDGFVLSREQTSDHVGQLAQLERVSGPAVVTAEGFALARAVADRYVGTLFDVLRMVVPARHARAERAALAEAAVDAAPTDAAVQPTRADRVPLPDSGTEAVIEAVKASWSYYEGGERLLSALTSPSQSAIPTRAIVTLASADDAMERITQLVCAAIDPGAVAVAKAAAAQSSDPPALAANGTCLVLVPDARVATAVTARLSPIFGSALARLTADLGPAQRYSTYLRILAGGVNVVVGTRAAVFAPMPHLVLAVMWDDGDDCYQEPCAPGWHAREVLAMRSSTEGAGLVYLGYARSVETSRMVHTGFLHSICPSRAEARARRPEVLATEAALGDRRGDASGVPVRVPPKAFEVIRSGLRVGPVLIQVARAGYAPATSCANCHRKAVCPTCSGPLAQAGRDAPPQCRWCGRLVADYVCPGCGGTALRAQAVGAERTAEELGRAFPGVPVLLSGSDHGVRDTVPDTPALVVATVGAEPTVAAGYGAAVLLDCDRILARPDIRAEEEAVRRWLNAVALVRSRTGPRGGERKTGERPHQSVGGHECASSHAHHVATVRPHVPRPSAESAGGSAGGTVLLVGDPAARGVQAVLRADPVGWSDRELADRREARLPPAWFLVAITGQPTATLSLLTQLAEDHRQVVHGPTAVARHEDGAEPDHRYLIVAPRAMAAGLAKELRAALISLSASGRYRQPSVRVDPVSLL